MSTTPSPTPSRRPRRCGTAAAAQARPLTDAQRQRNRELLVLAQRTTRPRSPRTTETLAEAS
ncbi:hypothetical protein Shyd_42420 [Streptomyces hydrogenans]|uniref:Uncharacterized protein n=1 Tax=Streptomyces hydrogenans TaxID=1873719 RepID=A0ABQ3PCX9_9ACTN|nr:hypothetical protein Shyd_42420 [Streptomyces hydrogenans]